MPALRSAPLIRDIVEEHAEEAASLWELRERALCAPNRTLNDLAELDERIEAHIDGLRIAAEPGREIAAEQLASEAAGAVFAAAVVTLESGDADRFRTVTAAVAAAPDSARGLIAALAWVAGDCAGARLAELLGSRSAVLASVGIAASVAHRLDPGAALHAAFASEVADLRRRAFAAVGRLGRSDLIASIAPGLQDPDADCRFWAAWASALLGDAAGLMALQRVAEAQGPFRERAAAMACRLLDLPKALVWHQWLAKDPSAGRAAIASAGAIGDVAGIPFLLEQMASPELARVAGEAFTSITGIDLRVAALEAPAAEFDAGPTDDPEDENVAMDPDEDLPWPSVDAIRGWWREHAGRFHKGQRYLLGRPIALDGVLGTLRTGTQRQRVAAALEAHAVGMRPLFETRAPARVQRVQLERMASSARRES
jgi:uncharacterized protein (TIGR02270 family)